MIGNEDGEFHHQSFQIAYHGDKPDDHSLNVEALAPALKGFSRLIRESNAVLNGDKAKVSLLVSSNFEHKCFHISFELVQEVYDKVKTLIQDEHVQTAKQLLQIIGAIRSTKAASLLDYLKWKKDKPVQVQATPQAATPSLITISIVGDDNTINISPEVFKLAERQSIRDAVKETLAPIEMKEATRIEFRENDQPIVSIDKAEAREIVRGLDAPDEFEGVEFKPVPDTVVATLYVYSPVFDEKAKRWRFVYKRNKHIYADISETAIAADAIKRGGSFVNDRYRVRMEVTEPEDDSGEPHYKIIEVLEFTPAPQQANLPLAKPRAKKAKGRSAPRAKKR
jgi:hypothetical protein